MVRISIVLPTCDRPGLVSEAIASVQAQEFSDWELIVVDDGRTPAEVPHGDERIRVHRTPGRLGPAAARNIALADVTGSVVAFLDDDDVFAAGRLAAIDAVHRNARIAVCGARFMDVTRGRSRRVQGWVEHSILDGPTPSLGRTSVDRELVPAFDEQWRAVEDVEWWVRLAPLAPIVPIEDEHYLVRRHDGPRVVNSLEARVEENRRFVEEHPYFASHRRAAAYRWRRIGMLASAAGRRRDALAAHWRSLRAWPSARSVRHLCRGLFMTGTSRRRKRTQPDVQWTTAATTTSGSEVKR